MKFKKVGLLLSVLAGLFATALLATPSEAATWGAKHAINQNPNCYTLTAGQPTAVVFFEYCGATPPAGEPALNDAISAYGGIPTPAANALHSSGYQVYYFQTFNDYVEEQTAPGVNLATAYQQKYALYSKVTGRTSPLNNSTRGSVSIIFETYPNGTYPNTAANPIYSHTVLHEAGHAYDYLFGTGTKNLSEQPQANSPLPIQYLGAMSDDHAYLLGQNGSNGQVWLYDTQHYVYFSTAPDFTELFAEQFAMGSSGTKWYQNTRYPQYQSFPPDLDYFAIQNNTTGEFDLGTVCANMWVWYYMNHSAPPSDAYYTSQYGPRCPSGHHLDFNPAPPSG